MITVSPSDMHSTATHAYNNGLPSVTHAPVNSRTTQQITTTKPHQSPQTMLHNELTVLKVDEQRQRAFTLPVTGTVLDVSVQLTADGQIKIRLSSVCTLQFKGFIYTKINSYYSHEKKSSQMLLAIILVNNAIKCYYPSLKLQISLSLQMQLPPYRNQEVTGLGCKQRIQTVSSPQDQKSSFLNS